MALPDGLIGLDAPGAVDLDLFQGDTFKRIFQLTDVNDTPYDLTGITPTSKVLDAFGGSLLLTFTCSVVAPASQGKVQISATPATTAALTVPGGTPSNQRSTRIGIWDLQLSDGTDITTPIAGDVNLLRQVTT